MKFEQSRTRENLAKAFAGESQARGRYEFLAERLRENGCYEIAKIVSALVGNELAHSKVFFDLIVTHSGGPVKNIDIAAGYPFKSGSVLETVNYASEDETAECDEIYPSFAETAEAEGYADIARIFRQIAQIECGHAKLLRELAEKMESDRIYTSDRPRVFKCANCGYESEGKEAWKTCPVCRHPQGFVEVELENRW